MVTLLPTPRSSGQTLPSPSLGPPLLSLSWSPPPFCGMLPLPPPDPLPLPPDPPLLDAAVVAGGALGDDCAAGLLVGWLFVVLDAPPQAVARASTPA
jgi:hypothetical protein